MTWQTVLKAKTGTHGGKDVTQMYHWLKRYFTRPTPPRKSQWKEIYLEYEELNRTDKELLAHYLIGLIGTPSSKSLFPGVEGTISSRSIVLRFNDNDHLEERDAWIANSYEASHNRYSWEKQPPADRKIQRVWRQIAKIVKKAENYRYQMSQYSWGSPYDDDIY